MIFPRYLTSSVEIECSSKATRSFFFSTIYLCICGRVSSRELRRLWESLPQILQCFEIVDHVCHGSSYAFAGTDRRQVRDFFASADGQCKGTFSYPRLLNLHVVRDVLDKLVKRRLVLLVSCETRVVQEIDDRPLPQQRQVGYRLFQRYNCLSKPLPARCKGASKLRSRCEGGACPFLSRRNTWSGTLGRDASDNPESSRAQVPHRCPQRYTGNRRPAYPRITHPRV